MTRARSQADHDAAAEAVRELARTRSHKESKAWELVTRHDNELVHVNRRLQTLETNGAEIRDTLNEISADQRDAAVSAQAVAEKLDHIELMQAEHAKSKADQEKYKRSLRGELFRNLVALGSLITAISAMAFRNCH